MFDYLVKWMRNGSVKHSVAHLHLLLIKVESSTLPIIRAPLIPETLLMKGSLYTGCFHTGPLEPDQTAYIRLFLSIGFSENTLEMLHR